jgi:hypothetical protein
LGPVQRALNKALIGCTAWCNSSQRAQHETQHKRDDLADCCSDRTAYSSFAARVVAKLIDLIERGSF